MCIFSLRAVAIDGEAFAETNRLVEGVGGAEIGYCLRRRSPAAGLPVARARRWDVVLNATIADLPGHEAESAAG
jgi:hypothetical protein